MKYDSIYPWSDSELSKRVAILYFWWTPQLIHGTDNSYPDPRTSLKLSNKNPSSNLRLAGFQSMASNSGLSIRPSIYQVRNYPCPINRSRTSKSIYLSKTPPCLHIKINGSNLVIQENLTLCDQPDDFGMANRCAKSSSICPTQIYAI